MIERIDFYAITSNGQLQDKINEIIDVVNKLEEAHPRVFASELARQRERNPFYRNDPELER